MKPTYTHRLTARCLGTPGFSLPEVAIAVAIASLALISILGLLPSGLESVRRSAELTGEARIVRQVLAELQGGDWGTPVGVTGWTNFPNLLNKTWYFDDQANPMQTSDDSFSDRLSYVVRVHGPGAVAGSPLAAAVPGGNTATVNAPPSAYILQIDVAASHDASSAFANTRQIQTQTVIVARQFYSTTSS